MICKASFFMLYNMQATPAPYRGPCETDGCNKQRWKQGYCQKCARLNGLCQFPTCAMQGCDRQAQSAGAGSICRPCRQTAHCETEGCERPPRGGGLCRTCRDRNNRAATTCAAEGCENVGFNGADRKWCQKHYRNRDACTRPQCARTVLEAGVCAEHCTESNKVCRVSPCASPRYLSRLCYKHYRENQLHKCGHPLCGRLVEGAYCGLHDVGIDFAAGDWHDWVAVEHLWAGKQGDRLPTVPELREVIRKAECRHVSYNELARRLGVDEDLMQRWRQMLDRLEMVEVAA